MTVLLISNCILIVFCRVAASLTLGEDSHMKKVFLFNVQAELGKCKASNKVFMEEDISNLTSPVQRYFRY